MITFLFCHKNPPDSVYTIGSPKIGLRFLFGLSKKPVFRRQSIGEIVAQGIKLQFSELMQPLHDLIVRISARENILPFQLNVIEEVVERHSVFAGGLMFLRERKYIFQSVRSLDAAMIAPQTNAYSLQTTQAAIPVLDAIALSAPSPVTHLPCESR